MVRDEEAGMAAKRAIQSLTSSVKEIAHSLGVSEHTVLAWKAERRSPSVENLQKLADVADRRADELRGAAVELRRIASEGED